MTFEWCLNDLCNRYVEDWKTGEHYLTSAGDKDWLNEPEKIRELFEHLSFGSDQLYLSKEGHLMWDDVMLIRQNDPPRFNLAFFKYYELHNKIFQRKCES